MYLPGVGRETSWKELEFYFVPGTTEAKDMVISKEVGTLYDSLFFRFFGGRAVESFVLGNDVIGTEQKMIIWAACVG